MTDVLIAGGGPAGLSAGIFTAKNGLETLLFDTDETWMHKAHLYNYPGIDEIGGTALVERMREQADDHGVDRRQGEAVTGVEATEEGFQATTDDGEYDAHYLVLATGDDRTLAADLGCERTDEDVVDVDTSMETSVTNAYATGAMVRPQEWEAVISAGDGSAAALNILSKEKGERFHDFDTPPEEG